MIQIKQEYLDCNVSCPLTGQLVNCRFIPQELYNLYNTRGLSIIFEEIPSLIIEEQNIEEENNDLSQHGEQ